MSTAPATILIVDDVAANRLVLERMVMARGHTAVCAENGREALDLMRAHSFDMVLLDIMMPVMSGYGVLAALSEEPDLRHVPVVVVSALNDMESVTRCVALGAIDYLFKPVNRTLLAARIDSCLARKRIADRERAAYAAVLEANRARSEFVGLVSHELKNPLTAILGYADMLEINALGPLSDEQSQSVHAISALAQHMGRILSDLSDLSHIEAGQLRLQSAATALTSICDMALKSVERSIAQKNQQLFVDLAPDLPLLWADPMRVVQILTNLLTNANKYTRPGGRISLSARATADDMIEIVVRDTGIGMSAADQHRVFERFFRSTNQDARQEGGSGLGLHITRLLVEAQGGAIGFSSDVNSGTTFTVALPALQRTIALPNAAEAGLSEVAL